MSKLLLILKHCFRNKGGSHWLKVTKDFCFWSVVSNLKMELCSSVFQLSNQIEENQFINFLLGCLIWYDSQQALSVFYLKRCWGKTTRGSIDTNRAAAAAVSFLNLSPRQFASTPSEEDVCCTFRCLQRSRSCKKLTFVFQLCDLGWRGQEVETQVVEIKADSKKWSRKSSYIFMDLVAGPTFQACFTSLITKLCPTGRET